MNRPRVFAMARPARPAIERDLVQAAEPTFRRASKSATAAAIARAVASDCIAFLEDDPLSTALEKLQPRPAASPIVTLARCADTDTTALVTASRTRRFVARNCQELGPTRRNAETAEILVEVSAILAERYRRLLG